MTDEPVAPQRGLDHEILGGLFSMALMVVIAVLGGVLLLQGDSDGRRLIPEFLRLPGLVLLMFCGVHGLGIVAACRKRAERRGWPQAAKGALWTSALAAVANVGVVAVLAHAVWRGMLSRGMH